MMRWRGKSDLDAVRTGPQSWLAPAPARGVLDEVSLENKTPDGLNHRAEERVLALNSSGNQEPWAPARLFWQTA